MKITLEFDSDNEDDMERYKDMMNATKYKCVIDSASNEIFRPARKHGYSDETIRNLIANSGENEDGYNNGVELIGQLEEMWYNLFREYNLEDL
jgi:hypothetical protein